MKQRVTLYRASILFGYEAAETWVTASILSPARWQDSVETKC
jgi:hypothetical protein